MADRTRVTIREVADAAGVSRQTVTRAMNDMAEISPATRQRVLDAARELGYRPSRFGRDLATGGRRTLGLVVNDLANPYYPELASAVVGAAAARGWNVLLEDTVRSPDRAVEIAGLVRQVDVVVGYVHLPAQEKARIFDRVPLVEIDADPGSPFGAVELDPGPAIAEAADHLLARGVRQPVALMPGARHPRQLAYRAAMEARGLPLRLVTCRETLAAATEAVEGLCRDGATGDAIVAFNDLLACGALKALRRAGVEVPGDVRLVGMDGLSLGTVVSPELTTLALDVERVAQAAVDLALGMHDGALPLSGPEVRRRVPHRFVPRESA